MRAHTTCQRDRSCEAPAPATVWRALLNRPPMVFPFDEGRLVPATLLCKCALAAEANRRARVHKKTAVDDPLLKVPPARRGNRTLAQFPSRSGGNLSHLSVPLAKRGEPVGGRRLRALNARLVSAFALVFQHAPLLQVPPASRGEPRDGTGSAASRGEPSRASTRFPLRAGGTLRRGSSTAVFL